MNRPTSEQETQKFRNSVVGLLFAIFGLVGTGLALIFMELMVPGWVAVGMVVVTVLIGLVGWVGAVLSVKDEWDRKRQSGDSA